jgi:hypothetical protein
MNISVAAPIELEEPSERIIALDEMYPEMKMIKIEEIEIYPDAVSSPKMSSPFFDERLLLPDLSDKSDQDYGAIRTKRLKKISKHQKHSKYSRIVNNTIAYEQNSIFQDNSEETETEIKVEEIASLDQEQEDSSSEDAAESSLSLSVSKVRKSASKSQYYEDCLGLRLFRVY